MVAYNGDGASYSRLSLVAQTAYARVLDLLLTSEAGPAIDGTIVSKAIRGRRYYYVQSIREGKKVQAYLGPESPAMEETVARWKRSRQENLSRAELVAMARAGGAHVASAAEAMILERLAQTFRIGAVLVGSHAFAVIGNTLGVRWQDAVVRTDDVDIAHDHRLAVALARGAKPVDILGALGDPIPRRSVLNPDHPATSFQVRGVAIEVDLLTPLVGRDRGRPISIPALGAAATPMRFLDYLIEDTQPGAVLGGAGVLVNVPRPGRFALHKLIVAARRGRGASSAKASKDRAQASALLQVLLAEMPGEIALSWKALERRGKAWTDAALTSVVRLDSGLTSALNGLGIRDRRKRRK